MTGIKVLDNGGRGGYRVPMTTAPTTAPKSLLSAKDRAALSPRQQMNKLVRIGKRALAKADWYAELARQDQRRLDGRPYISESHDPISDDERAELASRIAGLRSDRGPLLDKAQRATDEIAGLYAAHGDSLDLTPRQKEALMHR